MKKNINISNALKKIPLIFAVTVIVNIASGIAIGSWKASAYSSRIDNLELKISGYNTVPEDIAVIKATLAGTQKDIEFIKNYILRK